MKFCWEDKNEFEESENEKDKKEEKGVVNNKINK